MSAAGAGAAAEAAAVVQGAGETVVPAMIAGSADGEPALCLVHGSGFRPARWLSAGAGTARPEAALSVEGAGALSGGEPKVLSGLLIACQ